jgi:hypothetical protein
VTLYQVEADAEWSEIAAVIAEVLPDVNGKAEAAERGAGRSDSAERRS